MNISVAMATYNGAEFLREQLGSIANQTLLPYELVICDDGSSDDTLKIANAFSNTSDFPVHIYINEHNLGYPENFLKAASLCKGEWVSFCDQDDIWFKNKLERVAKEILNSDALLVVHSADLVYKNLKPYGYRMPDIRVNRIAPRLSNYPWWTPAGFTQTFNADLIKKYPYNERPHDFNYLERPLAHDKWIYFLANSLGSIAYVAESLVYYRRHSSTITGLYRKATWRSRLNGVRMANTRHYASLSNISLEYSDLLSNFTNNSVLDVSLSEKAISYYRRLSHILELRSLLYSSSGFKIRARSFIRLCNYRAYGNAYSRGLGYKALLKDMFSFIFP